MPLGTRLRSAWLALFASPAYAAVMHRRPLRTFEAQGRVAAFIPAQASRLHRLVSHMSARLTGWHREGRVPSRPRWLGATVATVAAP